MGSLFANRVWQRAKSVLQMFLLRIVIARSYTHARVSQVGEIYA